VSWPQSGFGFPIHPWCCLSKSSFAVIVVVITYWYCVLIIELAVAWWQTVRQEFLRIYLVGGYRSKSTFAKLHSSVQIARAHSAGIFRMLSYLVSTVALPVLVTNVTEVGGMHGWLIYYECLALQLYYKLAVLQCLGICRWLICQSVLEDFGLSCSCFWKFCGDHQCLYPFWPFSTVKCWWTCSSPSFASAWICLSSGQLSLLWCHLSWSVVEQMRRLPIDSWSHRGQAAGRFSLMHQWSSTTIGQYSRRIAIGSFAL